MTNKIAVSRLSDIAVLYKGDVYDLACMILKVYDAKDKGTNITSHHTVNGLFKDYAFLARLDTSQVIAVAVKHGLPLGATVEYDDEK